MRVSCTQLESFRLWRDQDWMDESDLIATILGRFTPTHKVELGKAFGEVLEDPDRYLVPGGFRNGTFEFARDVVEPCLACIDRSGVFEAKAAKAYGPCEVVAKADHLLGAHLREFKTTLSSFDAEKYADSYQWRFMVDIFEPLQVTYHVFCLSEATNGVIGLRGVETVNFFPYAALHEDCEALLQDFCRYVEVRGLADGLRARQREAA